jgi:glutamate-1-semialdehyde 2,1-aminomutase
MYSEEQSRQLYERAKRVVPRGTHSDSRVRTPHPRYFVRGDGAWVVDADGNRWLDCVMGNGAIILGHAHPPVTQAVEQQLRSGLGAGLESELSVLVAEQFLAQVRTAERVRFANTGTEAITHAIAMARARTGKSDIAKAEGSYHGWSDFVYVSVFHRVQEAGDPACPNSVAGMAGLNPAAVQSTLVLPFNDADHTERLLRANAHRLAAVVVEPVMIDIGWVPARADYLQRLREITAELGIVLIFDELLTGFRVAPGGAQEHYRVTPDLSIFGKALGNGYVIAAVAGAADIMDPVSGPRPAFVGTFNGHQTSLAASHVVLELLADGSVQRRLQARTYNLIEQFDEAARRAGVAAKLAGGGGHFHWYFTDREVTDYRSAASSDPTACKIFARSLDEHGVICSPAALQHHAISAAHGDAEIEHLLSAMRIGLAEVARAA